MSKRRKKKVHDRRHVMPGAALMAWRTDMGWSERDAAKRLGLSRQGMRNCEANGAPLYIAYTCAAIMKGLEPYGMSPEQVKDAENIP